MKRNKFSLSHYKLLSLKMGELIPVGLVEVLPGDTFQHATNLLVRCSPLVAPVMHPCHVRIHHWFVPHRIIWDDWEKFITGGPDGMDASVFPHFIVGTGHFDESSLSDYLGLPTSATLNFAAGLKVSALPYRAYSMIFNEWYRDQDLVTELTVSKASGQDTTTNTDIKNAAWEKDYFTTARPWTQKGPTVTIPLTGNAPVTGIGVSAGTPSTGATTVTTTQATGVNWASSGHYDPGAGGFSFKAAGTGANALLDIKADLSGVTSADIDTLRKAFALQRYEEARARYGSRYTEYLRYLGVRSSDARLQRPEYLGGGKQTIQFSEVLQTGGTSTGAATGVGNLHGHGIAAARSNRYRRFFEEHGYVMSLLSIKPRTIYQQGIPRTWRRTVKEDFWQKELEHIGQQEIRQGELFGYSATPDGVFGYQDRYDEYRRMESTVHGNFRSTLDFWHMARIFGADPALNGSFVTSDPTNRIFADQTGTDTVYVMASHSIQARRMLAKMGTSYIL